MFGEILDLIFRVRSRHKAYAHDVGVILGMALRHDETYHT